VRLADQSSHEALENNARLAQLLEDLPNKSREQKMKDAMSAMANLHEVLPLDVSRLLFLGARLWLFLLVCSRLIPHSSFSARNQVNRYNAEIHLKGAIEGAGARRS
jgi:hypothetical protein